MKKSLSVLFLFFLLFIQQVAAQVIRPERDAGVFPPSERRDEYNPFAEGVDTLDGEKTDTTFQLIAQNTDTINFVKVLRRYDLNLEQYEPVLSLDSVHQYQPVMRMPEAAVNIGNNGLPILELTKRFIYQEDYPIYGNSLTPYLYHNKNVNYYRAQRPYTRLKYVTGSERENNFEFEHTQNWGRGLNVGVQYERLVSQGFYRNQTIDHRNFAGHAWYQGKKKHFNSMAHYISNKYLLGANGGVVPGEDYYNVEDYDQRRNIPVSMTTAKNKYEGGRLNWQNSYDFGKNIDVKINDSISDVQIVPRFRVQHTLGLHHTKQFFTSDIAENNYFDASYLQNEATTADTLRYKTLSNEIRMKWLGNKLGDSSTLIRQNFLADAFARFSSIEINQLEGKNDRFSDLVVGGNFRSNPLDSPKIIYKAQGAYHLADYRQGDYFVRGEAGFDLNITGALVGFVEFTNQVQPYTANKIYQSHYRFSNDLGKLNSRVIGGYYKNENFNLDAAVRFANSGNILYFDENRQPQLSGDAVSYILANVHKKFQYKKFYLDAVGYYQTTSDTKAIRLPSVIGQGELYYKGPLFKNNVIAKIGFNGFYATDYDFLGYDPSLNQFYNQNRLTNYTNNAQYGFFSNFQLSRARVFLRLDNLGSFLVNQPIMQSAFYPQHDFAFRAGINWVFVN